MNKSLFEEMCLTVAKANSPYEVFGEIRNQSDLTNKYHAMAQVLHEDKVSDPFKERAKEAFQKLIEYYKLGREAFKAKSYGKNMKGANSSSSSTFTFSTKKASYSNFVQIYEGDTSDIFTAMRATASGAEKVLVKISLPKSFDRVKSEVETFSKIKNDLFEIFEKNFKDNDDKLDFLSTVVNFPIETGHISTPDGDRVILVFETEKLSANYLTLEEVVKKVGPLDTRDAAWIWRRLLFSLMRLHDAGVIHGAVIPKHYLVNTETHRGKFIGLTASSRISGDSGEFKYISPLSENYYPKEILLEKKIYKSSDLYMAACVMVTLLGGNVRLKDKVSSIPKSVPRSVRDLLGECLIENHKVRRNDLEKLYSDFERILKSEYGELKFRVFPKLN